MAASLALLAVVAVAASYVMSSRKDEVARSQVASLNAPDGSANAPQNAPSQHYKDLIKQNNQIRLDDAAKNGTPVVMAPLVGAGDPVAPPVVRLTPTNATPAPPKDLRDVVARRVAALSALNKGWETLPGQGVVAGTVRAVPAHGRGDVAAKRGMEEPALPMLPLLAVMHAVVDVGANSDYPSEMVARLTDGPLPGAKFLGRVASSNAGSNGVDRLTLRFSKMLYKNTYYDVEAIAVDAGSRIPAIKGDVNNHVVHNVVYQAGAAFLLGFAAASRASNPYVGISLGGTTTFDPYNNRQALQTAGAQTIAGTLQQGSFRGPTVTLPAGSAIGVVLIGPPHGAEAATMGAVRAPTDVSPASGDARENTDFRANDAPPAQIRTTAPDGTPIILRH
ncbi:MAG: hypothetical protein ABIW82_17060 [Dokdonella sp.]